MNNHNWSQLIFLNFILFVLYLILNSIPEILIDAIYLHNKISVVIGNFDISVSTTTSNARVGFWQNNNFGN